MPPKPFQPPRPSAASTKKNAKSKTTTGKPTSKSKPAKPASKTTTKEKPRSKSVQANARASGSTTFSRPSIASSLALDSDSDDIFASDPELEASPDIVDVEMEEAEEEEEREEVIPEALLIRLMHECFKNDNTRIGKDAQPAIHKYMETFVREAIARAAFARSEAQGGLSSANTFLEVEDLEKLAPQLILDF